MAHFRTRIAHGEQVEFSGQGSLKDYLCDAFCSMYPLPLWEVIVEEMHS